MLPFSREQFFEVFAAYNAATWPAAVAAYALALLAMGFAWRGAGRDGRWVAAILAVMWAWVGVAYHGLYFSRINPAASLFAAAFLVQASLLAMCAVGGRGLGLAARSRIEGFAGALLMAYALVAYPVVGLLAGERYPAIPLFGVSPCPLTILTLGLLVWSRAASWWLWVVPLAWSVLGAGAALMLAVPQDWGLPAAALAALLTLALRRASAARLRPRDCHPGLRCARLEYGAPRRPRGDRTDGSHSVRPPGRGLGSRRG